MTDPKLKDRIRDLLRKKNAILLSHNDQRPEVQDLADLCGGRLELSIKEFIIGTGILHAFSKAAPGKRFIGARANLGTRSAFAESSQPWVSANSAREKQDRIR
jgi:hypothetical protein